jgi:hypothetical protein
VCEAVLSTRERHRGGALDPFHLLTTMLRQQLSARLPALLLTIVGHNHHSPSPSELGICTASSFAPFGTHFQTKPLAIIPGARPSLVTVFLHDPIVTAGNHLSTPLLTSPRPPCTSPPLKSFGDCLFLKRLRSSSSTHEHAPRHHLARPFTAG